MLPNKKKAPAINSTSTADIAFMMLLFFLLTTSMDTDKGLLRQLPPPPQSEKKKEEIDVNKRNLLKVSISSTNDIMCAGEIVSLERLKEKVKEFIDNPMNSEDLPLKTEVDIPLLGKHMITRDHVISLQCDRTTQYQVYINVQNELVAAYNELRGDLSKKEFGRKYSELDKEEMEAVATYYRQVISEAEPKDYGSKK